MSAAEFTIASPDTPLGWAILAAIAFTFLWVVVRGFVSFFDKVSTDFLGPVFWSVFAILALIFLYAERPWEKENLIEADINVNTGVQGIEAQTGPGDRIEPDRTHDDN